MKILVISDVHINDYPNYEFYRYQRLNWYIDYANRIVEIAKSRNINTLFIAGDFYDKPVNDPTILNVARKVIDTFDSYFDKVYYILGQHDLKTKNYWIKDLRPFSVMNATAPSKWIYGDHKVFQIGGRRVAMMNFNPEPDLDWITDPVDLFIGHVTINTNGFGSDIDYSKFILGIAGDIHYPCSCNNLHSVGSQVQRYLGDAENGTCVIVNMKDLSWSRIEVDPNNELFTRYRKIDKYEDEGPSDELIRENCPKYYYIYRTNEAISEGDTLNIVDDKVKTIDEIITKNIEANGLEEVHQDVLNHFVDVNHIDLNFKLNKITIINVRSIDEMVINFNNRNGLLELSGNNGCFTGDTKVLTLDGKYKTLEELYNSKEKNIPIYTCNPENNWELKVDYAEECVLTKYVDKLCYVTIDDGTIYKCTEDHLFLTIDRGYVKAKELKPSDSLVPIHRTLTKLFRKGNDYELIYSTYKSTNYLTHHLVGELLHPGFINDGLIVHHNKIKDDGIYFDSLNNLPENLLLMTPSEHGSLHRLHNIKSEVKTGYFSETISTLNSEGHIIYGKIVNLLRIGDKEGDIVDYRINENLYEELRTKYIDLGWIHYSCPHWNAIEYWGFKLEDLWNDTDYPKDNNYKDQEFIDKNLEDKSKNSGRLSNFNSNNHPNLRKDVNYESVIAKARELNTYNVWDLANAFDCSRSKINSVIYSEFNTIQEFAEYLGFEYYNHKVKSVEIVACENIPVYDLVNSGKWNNFAIAANDEKSGVFVHNSGKSSIIWSINYALRGGLDIRDEVREGTDSASVYLELTYQGKQYGIYRGTDGVSLDIDGEYQNLGSKRDTEAGIYELLPFINYLDSFFFMDDSVSIMGSYAAERRIELLSTYYRLDVISTYASLGKGLLDELYKEGNQKWTELEQEKKIIEDLSLKFNEAKEKSKGIGTKEFIENKISELNQEYKDSVVYFDKLDSIDSIKRSLSVVKKNEKDYEFKISNLKNEIDSLVIPDIAPEQVDEEKLEEVKNKGISIYKELEKLDIKLENNKEILNKFSSLTCPECGSNIDIVDLQPRSKEEIKSNIYELELEIKSKNEDYESLSEEYSELQKSQKSWKKYQDNLAKKSNLESKLESLKESLEETKNKINDLESQLDEFDSKTCREPDLIMKEINNQNYSLKLLEDLSIIESQLSSAKENSRINSLTIEIEELEKKSSKYEKYVELLGDNGSLYELVLNSILTRFNSDKFKYEVVKSVYRGREYNDVIGYYKAPNMKRFRNYWRLSRGQRTLVDLDFIRNLVRGSGIIVFDEILKYLDSYNFTEGLSIIHSMNSPLKIITSQNENTIYVDCQIKLTYDGNITQIDS